jgi:hypothetical protein
VEGKDDVECCIQRSKSVEMRGGKKVGSAESRNTESHCKVGDGDKYSVTPQTQLLSTYNDAKIANVD